MASERTPPSREVARAARDLIDRFGARSWTNRLAGLDPKTPVRMVRIARGGGRVSRDEARAILEARANLAMISRLERKAISAGVRGRTRDRLILEWLRTAKRPGDRPDAEQRRKAAQVLVQLGVRKLDKRLFYVQPAPGEWGMISD
jgi:hypothetical protein